MLSVPQGDGGCASSNTAAVTAAVTTAATATAATATAAATTLAAAAAATKSREQKLLEEAVLADLRETEESDDPLIIAVKSMIAYTKGKLVCAVKRMYTKVTLIMGVRQGAYGAYAYVPSVGLRMASAGLILLW